MVQNKENELYFNLKPYSYLRLTLRANTDSLKLSETNISAEVRIGLKVFQRLLKTELKKPMTSARGN